jgi:hypothetical protein
MKSGEKQTQLINIPKLIEAIRVLRAKLLDVLPKLPSAPLERDRVLRDLGREVAAQVGIDDYLTLASVDALIFVFDKPFADTVYTSIMNDVERLSKLKLAELKIEPRSMYEVKIVLRLQRLTQDEFKQHIQALKSMKFKFDDILKCWYKIYEAGKPIVHPLA